MLLLLLLLLCRLCRFPGFIEVVRDLRKVSWRRLRREKSMAKGCRRRCCTCCGVSGEAASCSEPFVRHRPSGEDSFVLTAAPAAFAPAPEASGRDACVRPGTKAGGGGGVVAAFACVLASTAFLLAGRTTSKKGTCTTNSLVAAPLPPPLRGLTMPLIASCTAFSSIVSASSLSLDVHVSYSTDLGEVTESAGPRNGCG